jgi:hypothetical protein
MLSGVDSCLARQSARANPGLFIYAADDDTFFAYAIPLVRLRSEMKNSFPVSATALTPVRKYPPAGPLARNSGFAAGPSCTGMVIIGLPFLKEFLTPEVQRHDPERPKRCRPWG